MVGILVFRGARTGPGVSVARGPRGETGLPVERLARVGLPGGSAFSPFWFFPTDWR